MAVRPKSEPEKRRPLVPCLLKELGLKVTKKGVLLPESRKTVLRRRRETRQALEGEQEALQPVLKKRKTGGPVQLDDVESELFYGSHQGSVQACAQAVAKGADVNVRTKADLDGVGIGATALHVAAFRGHEDVVTALLRAKADAVATTGRGEMPLQLATRMGHVEVVKVLRAAGAAPQHAEGVLQLMSQAPASWRDGQRKKLRQAIQAPPPPPPGDDARQGLGAPKKGKGKGKRRWKGKGKDH